MKKIRLIKSKNAFLLGLILILCYGCERDISDEAVPATFPTIGDIFTDTPIGLTEEFFNSFDPAAGANVNGFGTDNAEAYEGSTSIRIDVPAPNDPDGGFIGGIFEDAGEGRNLTQYDALTFWAKGSTTGIVEAGFGTDFVEDKYAVSFPNIQLSTDWKKYIIPIPDPSKLVQEKGMFLFAAGTQSTNGFGFTFWIDELRFENLGTLGQEVPRIFNGANLVQEAFIGSTIQINGISYTANLPSGINQTINAAPSYFEFSSSNESVATVSELGVISVSGVGTTTITATLGNNVALGELELTSVGPFPSAPVPTRDAANVISLFSDAYTNVPVRHYNGFFEPFQTTEGGAGADPNNVDLQVPAPGGGVDNIINYTSLNFVSIGTYDTVPLVDISAMSHLHVDINVRETIDGGDFLRISLESGTGVGPTTSGNFIINSAALGNTDENGWLSLDIPISSFSGFSDPANLGQVFFVTDATISDIWVDNVYFYNE
ncbi:Ig-like domain-containing protein [uncultured Psychroserpens sp.]|uniref:Ig-like domain-containing protein n=1 Tax=uncultured Psychroserpens sp. TaxID=255436 RepID=UPI0026201FBC|nr:Ig-like domain-containing protein [uncultured Psychroserpens sp.]